MVMVKMEEFIISLQIKKRRNKYMGQFSWLDCKSQEQILDDVVRDVYLLIPKQFGGGHLKEKCYEGYGEFAGTDVYDLLPDWNKGMIPEIIRRSENGNWICPISEEDKENLMAFYNDQEINCKKRHLGIIMGCYDKDNFALEYPIKITHNESAVYEDCRPSLSDPDQGWLNSRK